MSPREVFPIIFVVCMAALVIAAIVFEWRENRRVRRWNAKAQADYQAARIAAKRDGTRPPFPPNTLTRW